MCFTCYLGLFIFALLVIKISILYMIYDLQFVLLYYEILMSEFLFLDIEVCLINININVY